MHKPRLAHDGQMAGYPRLGNFQRADQFTDAQLTFTGKQHEAAQAGRFGHGGKQGLDIESSLGHRQGCLTLKWAG
jgi:hypothetical protein